MSETGSIGTSSESGAAGLTPGTSRRHHVSAVEWAALAVLLAVFAGTMTYLCNMRYLDFFTTNWDLGINQQLLWTTSHGRLLYEAGDYEFYGVQSFLQVHSAYVALLVAPLYSLAPAPATLFALQASVFAASAVPLYLIGRRVVRSPALLFLAVGLYLVSLPALSSLFYDFHWESFLPLESFGLFYLLERRRFAWSLFPLLAGSLTLEVFPFVAGGILLYFLVSRAQELGWRWRPIGQDTTLRLLVAVGAIAVAAYVLIRLSQVYFVPWAIGIHSGPAVPAGGLGLGLEIHATRLTLLHSAVYWLVALAAFGFLPLLTPRYLLLSVPWFIGSVFLETVFSVHYGTAYGFVDLTALAPAFLFGLGRFESRLHAPGPGWLLIPAALAGAAALLGAAEYGSRELLSDDPSWGYWAVLLFAGVTLVATHEFTSWRAGRPRPTDERPARRARRWRRVLRGPLAPLSLALLAVLVGFNLLLSPLNAVNFDATPIPGYQFEYGINPMSGEMAWVTGQIPAEAQVLAGDHLFPYVANNPNAWPLPWFVMSSLNPVPYFPFTSTNLPRYVLIDQSEYSLLPLFLQQDTFDPSVYGLVAYVYTIPYPGTVYLFELGYRGPTASRLVSSPYPTEYFTYHNLTLGPLGTVETPTPGRFGGVIASRESTGSLGDDTTIWYGPYQTFLPGNYLVRFNLSGSSLPGVSRSAPILFLTASTVGVAGPPFIEAAVSVGTLSGTDWTNLEFDISLTLPYPNVEFRGYLAYTGYLPAGAVQLNFIEVTAIP